MLHFWELERRWGARNEMTYFNSFSYKCTLC